MQYSPKLKKAMEEIKTILKENDITGVVILHEPNFSEYLISVESSYSAAVTEPDGIKVRVRTAEVGKEKAKQLATDTMNMVHHFVKHLTDKSMYFMQLEEVLSRTWDAEHFSGGESSHIDQNN